MLSVGRSALTERGYGSFPLRLTQLDLRSFHVARRLLAKQNRAEFVSQIIACSEFLLRVRALKINTRWQHAEIANKIHPQIEHFRPKIGDLLVANAFFAGHVGPCDQTLALSVLPMRLAPHTAHYPIWIKCKVAYRINPFFFCLKIFSDRRPMWSSQRRLADKIEIWFCPACDHCQANCESVAAFCLDVAQNSLALKAIETFAHR